VDRATYARALVYTIVGRAEESITYRKQERRPPVRFPPATV